jgi:hypothetical protein
MSAWGQERRSDAEEPASAQCHIPDLLDDFLILRDVPSADIIVVGAFSLRQISMRFLRQPHRGTRCRREAVRAQLHLASGESGQTETKFVQHRLVPTETPLLDR